MITIMPLLKDTQQATPHRSRMNISVPGLLNACSDDDDIESVKHLPHCVYDVYHHSLFAELCFGFNLGYTWAVSPRF